MKKPYLNLIFTILLFVLAGCQSSTREPLQPVPATSTKGGGEYGGGDLLQIPATPEEIVALVPRIQAILPYSFNFMGFWHYSLESAQVNMGSENGDEVRAKEHASEDSNFVSESILEMPKMIDGHPVTFDKMKNLGRILFLGQDQGKTVYDYLRTLKITVYIDRACKDKSGQEKDGSVHGDHKGDICISALRLSKKVKRIHLFNSILGMIVHEIIHRMGGDSVETEAKIAEYITRNVPITHANGFFAIEGRYAIQSAMIRAEAALAFLTRPQIPTEIPAVFHETNSNAKNQIDRLKPKIRSAQKKYDELMIQGAKLEGDIKKTVVLDNDLTASDSVGDLKSELHSESPHDPKELYKKLAEVRSFQVEALVGLNYLENSLKLYEDQLSYNQHILEDFVSNQERTYQESDTFLCSNLQALNSEFSMSTIPKLAPQPLVALSTLTSNEFGLLLAQSSQASAAESFCYTESEFDKMYFLNNSDSAPATRFHSSSDGKPLYFMQESLPPIYRVRYKDKEVLEKVLRSIIDNLKQLSSEVDLSSPTRI
ncbi:MAG: hypothetical protein KDD61_16145 [Bdellovibrionales bacterium]|nr:hypothetical protein [Bdellovibrionales bacterium]